MANGDDSHKPPWSSWLAPGDVRRAGSEAPHWGLDSDAKRQLSQERLGQSSQLQQHGQDHSVRSEDTYNPLIAFKHFVDDRIAAIAEFPSKFTELKRVARDFSTASVDLEKACNRWTGHDQKWTIDFYRLDGELLPDVLCDAKELAAMLIRESDWRNRHVSSDKIIALFEDKEFNPNRGFEANSPWPFHYRVSFNQSQESGQSPSLASLTHWLSVNWFKHNPYSPVNLEVDPMLAKYDTKWRNSFEDLLEASLDKPMTSRDKAGNRPFSTTTMSTWHGPGRDWMFSLQCRGILPPQLPSMYSLGWVPTDYSTTPAKEDTSIRTVARPDLDVLVREIAVNIIQDGVGARPAASLYDWKTPLADAEFDAEGAELESAKRICPRHTDRVSSEDHAYETSLAERYYRDQLSGYDEANASADMCPDEPDRAIDQATHQLETALTELDLYGLEAEHAQCVEQAETEYFQQLKPLYRPFQEAVRDEYGGVDEAPSQQTPCNEYAQQLKLLEEQNARRSMAARRDEASDMSETARQQAARAFADEENGLGEDGSFGRHCSSEEELTAQEYYFGSRDTRSMTSEELFVRETSRLYKEFDRLYAKQDALGKRVTELALDQKALVERQEAHEQKQAPRMLEREAPIADRSLPLSPTADSNRPQVLSTLTTTQTTRLPDGSVKTTVVLKRRFADGGEETHESTQTSFDEPAAAVGGALDQEPSRERKSWFWS